ncbi:MAG: copper homeostasis protein CutC [Bacteroidales bacterium]|nr:copper homeostasis protein CutC [Bacteroidales bacterium]
MIYRFEICANSVASCIAAQKGGADRVELCAGIPEGGTTPSFGMIKCARESISIGLNVIIRPRGGDFLYSEDEIKEMTYDIGMAKDLGADGLVFGCLRSDGHVDMEAMKILMDAAGNTPVTFHRAFDHCCDPFKALEDIISLGCVRILTSGCRPTAPEGVGMIAELVRKADDRIIIMPGCGINEDNIAETARLSGAKEFHFSARKPVESGMSFRNPDVTMGTEEDPYATVQTTVQRVADTIAPLKS